MENTVSLFWDENKNKIKQLFMRSYFLLHAQLETRCFGFLYPQ